MGRWGEEEKKSKGLVGCFIWSGILGLVLFMFYINLPRLDTRRQLEKDMQSIVRTGIFQSEEILIAKIIEAAEDREVFLETKDVSLEISPDGYGNFIIDCKINFPVELNFLVAQYDINLPIYEKVTLIP